MKAHQNIIVSGIDVGDNPERRGSRFRNEGKWDNFIKPILPKDDFEHTLIEFGTNAGLYLKLAKEHGYRILISLRQSQAKSG